MPAFVEGQDQAREDPLRAVARWLGTPETSDAATATAGSSARAEQPTSLWGRVGQTVGDLGRGLSQEGVGGLVDLEGMLDRQQAQRDLSDRFQVLDDDFVGPRNHNQVTQAEYEEIARTYSNIRLGRGDLTIDSSQLDNEEDQRTYEEGALNNIADIMMTTSGRRQISALSDNPLMDDEGNARLDDEGDEMRRHTTIRPLFQDDTTEFNASNLASDNAYADPVDWTQMSRDEDGNRGMGTDVNIRWNPLDVDDARSDVILVHEMQHALHETQGTMAHGSYDEASGGQGPDATYQEFEYDDDGNLVLDEDGNPNVLQTGIANFERQAVGLTRTDANGQVHYPGDPDGCTENDYRFERNQLGLGEMHLPRTDYTDLPGQAKTREELDAAWEAHLARQAAEAEQLANP